METEKNVCFACLKSNNLLNIFDTYTCDGKEERYNEFLSKCFNIEINKDSNLNVMCTNCIIKLRDAFYFREETVHNMVKLLDLKAKSEESELQFINTSDLLKTENDSIPQLDPETGQVTYSVNILNEYFNDYESLDNNDYDYKEDVNVKINNDKRILNYENENNEETLNSIKIGDKLGKCGLLQNVKNCNNKLKSKENCNLENNLKIEQDIELFENVKKIYNNNVENENNVDYNNLKLIINNVKLKDLNNCDLLQNVKMLNDNLKTEDNVISKKLNVIIQKEDRTEEVMEGTNNISKTQSSVQIVSNTDTTDNSTVLARSNIVMDTEQEMCSICNEKFVTSKKLIEHMNIHFPYHICEVCGKEFTKARSLKNHILTHRLGPFVCSTCNKAFTNINTRNSHKWRVHRAGGAFPCSSCGERFPTVDTRRRHELSHDTKSLRYPCPHCSKYYRDAGSRSKHIKFSHLRERPHKCPHCTRAFPQKYRLEGHLASAHKIGEKKHSCADCSKKFSSTTSLNTHIRIKHSFVKINERNTEDDKEERISNLHR